MDSIRSLSTTSSWGPPEGGLKICYHLDPIACPKISLGAANVSVYEKYWKRWHVQREVNRNLLEPFNHYLLPHYLSCPEWIAVFCCNIFFFQETRLSLCSSASAENVASVRAQRPTSVRWHGEFNKYPSAPSHSHFLLMPDFLFNFSVMWAYNSRSI